MKFKHAAILILIGFGAYVGYNYIYQEHRDIDTEVPEFNVNSVTISNEFQENTTHAETKYLNKTITVSGTITEVTENNITLNDQVFCQFTSSIKRIYKLNNQLTIKGRVIGYDDLLEQVKIDQCHIN